MLFVAPVSILTSSIFQLGAYLLLNLFKFFFIFLCLWEGVSSAKALFTVTITFTRSLLSFLVALSTFSYWFGSEALPFQAYNATRTDF
jgi:hypothetical protein